MDELKKDGLPSDEEENTVSEEVTEEEALPEEAEKENGLIEELEEIRDMFQKELDKAADNEDEEGMLIQELDSDEEKEEDEEIAPEDLCQCCEEKIRFKEFDEDYPYCEDCRNAMKKYPLRKSGVFAFIASVVILVVSLYVSLPYMDDAFVISDASSNFQSGYVMSALQSYYSYFNGGKTGKAISKRALDEIIEGYNNLGYQADSTNLINTYFSEDELKRPWNKKYGDAAKNALVVTETFETVSKITEDAFAGKDFDYDKMVAELEALKTVNPIEEGKSQVTEKYNEVFIEFYKYVLMSIKKFPLTEQFEQLKYIDSIGKDQEWVYLSNYCAIAAKLGDEEAVNYSFEKLLKINKEDSSAFLSKANLYRFTETPDADKMIEACKEAEAILGTTDLSYKHSLAIAYLIKGEGSLALEEIKALFDSGRYTVQNCNLYALCALYNGNKDIYGEMKTLLKNYGYEISELVTQYKNGKMTIEEIIKDQGGDI